MLYNLLHTAIVNAMLKHMPEEWGVRYHADKESDEILRPAERRVENLQRLFTLIFADDTAIICRESYVTEVEERVLKFFAKYGATIHPGKQRD